MLILGSLDGVETGIRQLVRRRPLEVERIAVPGGEVVLPSAAEMLRTKAWMVLRRNATRDHLDVVALAEQVADPAGVLAAMDDYYADQLGEGGRRVAGQMARQLAQPAPYDLADVDLTRYRRLREDLRDWRSVADRCVGLAAGILQRVAEGT